MRAIRFVGLFCVLFAIPSVALAESVVNIDIGSSSFNPSDLYVGQGAYSDPGNNVWNDYSFGDWANAAPSGNLLDSTGAATSVSFDILGAAHSPIWVSSNDLLEDGAMAISNLISGPIGFRIAGLSTSATYDLYLYGTSASHAGQYSAFTVGTSTLSTTGGLDSGYVEGVNYVRFSGVAPDQLGQIDGSWTHPAGTPWAPFNGLQIIENSAPVPEPCTLTLFAGGALVVTLGRRRRRRRTAP